jgi:hypothetical protein
MELVYARCAGLDVHAATVVACVRIAAGGTVTYDYRTVSTSTRGCSISPSGSRRMSAPTGAGGDGRLLEAGLAHT